MLERPARTILRFSINGEHPSVVIPKGTRVSVTDDIEFVTLNDDVITPLISYVEIEAACNKPGTVGNGWERGRIKTLKSEINFAGKITVTNIDVPSGGLLREEDDPYRARILAARKHLPVAAQSPRTIITPARSHKTLLMSMYQLHAVGLSESRY